MMTSNNTETKQGCLDRKDLNKMTLRSLKLGIGWHYERQMHLGFAYMMEPLLAKIYGKGTDKYKEALARHLEFFNCTYVAVPFIGSIAASMEETNADTDDFDTSAISQVKIALMGPLSGVGDSLVLGTLRGIATSVGVSLAAGGSWLGALLYLIILNVPQYLLRFFGAYKGYEMGTKYLEKIQESHLLDKIMYAAGIVGIMTVGGMVKTMVSMNCIIPIGTGEAVTTLQETLDGILPGILGVGVTALYYYLLKKNVNILWLILGTCVVGVLLAFLGILG